MDMLRSCYSTRMRFFSDHPEIETLVHWYFCEPEAKVFPHRTVFNSGNWWNDKTFSGPLGEVAGAPRPWRNGQPPGPYDGQDFCGTPSMFLNGEPAPPSPPVERLANGVPTCCASDDGGLLYSGTGTLVMIANEVTARYATTMDVYRVGVAPPAAPSVPAVQILLEADFHIRSEASEGDAAVGHYSHTALIQSPPVDVRDDYNEGTRGSNYDSVYIPDKTGTGFVVRFVEIIALEGSAALYQRVYLDRKIPPNWPATA